jgi:uncharacterized protein (TIGR02302 family)
MSADRRRIEGRIGQARMALGFETLWAGLLWPIVALAAIVALLFTGVTAWVPEWPRIALLGLLALGFLWSLKPLFRIAFPGRAAAIRRLETEQGLAHRPVSGIGDTLTRETASDAASALWEEHRLRQLATLKDLAPVKPKSSWRDLDPMALRVPALLALGASLVLNTGQLTAHVKDAFRLEPPVPPQQIALDAWIKPPPYTGKAPMLLTSPAMVAKLKSGDDLLVPESSGLTVQLTGAASPTLVFLSPGPDGGELKDVTAKTTTANGQFKADMVLTRPLRVKLMDGASEVASWPIAVIPDAPPTIAFSGEAKAESGGNLSIKWHAADDYGVTAVSSALALSDEQENGPGFEKGGIFLYDAPQYPVALRRARPKAEDGSSSNNLAAHPWAGFMVDMTLIAKDGAGHTAISEKIRLKLPERLFVDPLAKALIEQRKILIVDNEAAGDVADLVQALLVYPDGLIAKSGTHLAIASVLSRLRNIESDDDIRVAVDDLWKIAVAAEEGDLGSARAELEALRRELEKAIAEGASPERIKELMSKMRDAMNRLMREMAEDQKRRMQQGGPKDRQQAGREISPQDLQKMLDEIEKLTKSGDKNAAQDLLAQLDEILRNLKPGQPRSAQGQNGDQMSQMLDELSEMMKRQQGLMDQTQRMPQPGEGDPQGEQQQQPGSGGKDIDPEGLAGAQRQIGDMLGEIMKQLGQNGMQVPKSFGDAQKQMDGAAGDLEKGNREGALGKEGEALQSLRDGAQDMAKQMAQQGRGQQNNLGEHGDARGDNDPLGRPRATKGEDRGPNENMLPTEQALRRAREILDMLRSRANEPNLPSLDRSYIDRLLRGLY